MNSLTILDSSFCNLLASAISNGWASGSRAAKIGRSYLEKKIVIIKSSN